MRELVALDLPGGPAFVAAMRAIWADGDAIMPVDQRWPATMRAEILTRFGVGAVVGEGGRTLLNGGWPVDNGDAVVIATSGSTGPPKGVVLTHEAIAASAAATSARLGVRADDHWLACLPLAHVGGLSVVFRALHTDTQLTVLPAFDPAAVERSGATLVSLVATALRRIDPSRFRTIVLGGSRPPVDRPPNSVTTYGMTETGSGVVYDRRPLDGVEIRIVDGEIQIRGSMLLRAYRDGHDPKSTEGWLPTGDLGSIDADGLLSVDGRRSDLIISGGENVWPESVEAVIRTLPGVADVAVIGRDDPEWGQRVEALVVPVDATAAPTLDHVRRHVRDRLPAYCAPRRVTIVAGLPRTTLGKLHRSELGGSDR